MSKRNWNLATLALAAVLAFGTSVGHADCTMHFDGVQVDKTHGITMTKDYAYMFVRHPKLYLGSAIRIPLDEAKAGKTAKMMVSAIESSAEGKPLSLDVLVRSNMFCESYKKGESVGLADNATSLIDLKLMDMRNGQLDSGSVNAPDGRLALRGASDKGSKTTGEEPLGHPSMVREEYTSLAEIAL